MTFIIQAIGCNFMADFTKNKYKEKCMAVLVEDKKTLKICFLTVVNWKLDTSNFRIMCKTSIDST